MHYVVLRLLTYFTFNYFHYSCRCQENIDHPQEFLQTGKKTTEKTKTEFLNAHSGTKASFHKAILVLLSS